MADRSIFNNTITPGFVDPIEDRDSIDLLKSAEAQLRETMLAKYEPNKLDKQTDFNAICLSQLSNVLVGDKSLVRIKARIPELHNLLPVPKNANDLQAISLYPTFKASKSDFSPQPTNNSIVPGTHVVVGFDNVGNFADGSIKKIFHIKSASDAAAITAKKAKEAAERPTKSPAGTGTKKGRQEEAPEKLEFTQYKDNEPTVQEAMKAVIAAELKLVKATVSSGPGKIESLGLATYPKPKKGQKKWKYPKRSGGWRGRCLQYASILANLVNEEVGKPYGDLSIWDKNKEAGAMWKKKDINEHVYQWITSQNTRPEKVKTSSGEFFGRGCTLRDLSQLGILPGMVVHIDAAWDKKPAATYPLAHSFHHWLIYVGESNGVHYYCDGKGFKVAASMDAWSRGWFGGGRGLKKRRLTKNKVGKLNKKIPRPERLLRDAKKFVLEKENPATHEFKVGDRYFRQFIEYLESKGHIDDIEKDIKNYSKQPLVRHVYTLWDLN